jgi:hypothetical protein
MTRREVWTILWKYFLVSDDDKTHTDRVLEECAKKVCKDLFSNLRIQATNSYLKDHGVDVNYFKERSSTFLTLEQYAEVSDSLLILSFLTTCESC